MPSPGSSLQRTRNWTLLRCSPPSCVIGGITWEIESLIHEAQRTEPDPGTGPPGRLFVPVSVRSQVLQWAHTARFSCHPGVHRTTSFVQRFFWWPTLAKDTRENVTACTTCAQNKLSHQPPSGLLHPLPTPGRPAARGLISPLTSSLVCPSLQVIPLY